MASYLLLDDLRARLKKQLSDWVLRKPNQNNLEEYCLPNFYIGQLPPKKGSVPKGAITTGPSDTEMPFIIIRPLEFDYSNELPIKQIVNVAIICAIYSEESMELYEKGVQDIVNLMDQIVLSLKSHLFWGDNYFSHNGDLKVTFGLPKSIDPYEAGLQADAPFFASVLLTSFERSIPITQEYSELIN